MRYIKTPEKSKTKKTHECRTIIIITHNKTAIITNTYKRNHPTHADTHAHAHKLYINYAKKIRWNNLIIRFVLDDSPSSTVTAAPFKKGEDWKFPEVALLPPAPLPTEVASCLLLLPLVDGEEYLPLSPPPLCCLSLLPMEGEVSPPLPTQALPHLHPSAILSPSAL